MSLFQGMPVTSDDDGTVEDEPDDVLEQSHETETTSWCQAEHGDTFSVHVCHLLHV